MTASSGNAAFAAASRPRTCVYLVGAGPGDPGLITVRGRDLLAHATAVVYDYLASPALLSLAPAAAERINVGKQGFERHITQPEINDILVAKARELDQRAAAGELDAAGAPTIVRLKGGDPFVFGRGGEEALALAGAGIPFEVVPGITAGAAAPAYAGIPITHRGLASAVTFVTGNEDPTKDETALDWEALARVGGTLCFYMGMRNLPLIAEKLIEHGRDPQTPAALVRWGTTCAQQTLTAPLSQVARRAAEEGFGAPAIIVVGDVASLHDELSWFERRPLFGRRIVVTRSRTQASDLVRGLAAAGAETLEVPTIEIAPPASFEALDAALDNLAAYQWVVFTSANGVDAFFERLAARPRGPRDARALGAARVGAIGPATAARLERFGVTADVVPDEYVAERTFDALVEAGLAAGERVLIPRAAEAREALPRLLRAHGAQVDVAAAYETRPPADSGAQPVREALESGQVDAVTFTSSSTARNFLSLLGPDAARLLEGVDLFSIGPITTQTLSQHGFDCVLQAADYTIPGLIARITFEYQTRG